MGTSAAQNAGQGAQSLSVDEILANPDRARALEFVHHPEADAGAGGTAENPTSDGVVHRFDPSAGVSSGADQPASSGTTDQGTTAAPVSSQAAGSTSAAATDQGASSGAQNAGASQAASSGGAAAVRSVIVTLSDGTSQTINAQ
jgi:hypothetical protein